MSNLPPMARMPRLKTAALKCTFLAIFNLKKMVLLKKVLLPHLAANLSLGKQTIFFLLLLTISFFLLPLFLTQIGKWVGSGEAKIFLKVCCHKRQSIHWKKYQCNCHNSYILLTTLQQFLDDCGQIIELHLQTTDI